MYICNMRNNGAKVHLLYAGSLINVKLKNLLIPLPQNYGKDRRLKKNLILRFSVYNVYTHGLISLDFYF